MIGKTLDKSPTIKGTVYGIRNLSYDTDEMNKAATWQKFMTSLKKIRKYTDFHHLLKAISMCIIKIT
jgi:hypothetical protein